MDTVNNVVKDSLLLGNGKGTVKDNGEESSVVADNDEDFVVMVGVRADKEIVRALIVRQGRIRFVDDFLFGALHDLI